MKVKHLFIALFSLILTSLSAQRKYELGKVTVDELKESVHPLDTSASAAILFKKGSSRFQLQNGAWEIQTDVSFKIKIYKKEGLKYADFKIPYYVGGSSSENVFFSDAATYNLVNGKVEKTKMKSESEFKEEVNENWKRKKITLPAVKEGSIIEFSYRFVSPYISTFNDFRFQTEIPTNYVEYEVYMPKYFIYNSRVTGYVAINTRSEQVYSSNFGETKTVYFKDNVPAIKDEAYVNNIDNYTSILKFELASIEYPNEATKNVAMNWEGVTTSIYKEEGFGNELEKKGYFEEDLNAVLKEALTPNDKMNAIYNFVKKRMTWNERGGIFCRDGVKKAYKETKGNAAEINLMLVAMLRYAGLEANPILISTRDNGISIFPSRTSFNHVIAGVEVENDIIMLDAVDKNAFPDIMPIQNLNWFGRVIRANGSSAEVELMPDKLSSDVVSAMATIAADGTVEGKVKEQYFDYNAYLFRDKYANLAVDNYLEKLEKHLENTEVSGYEVNGKNDPEKPLIETYSFRNTNVVEIIGDKMYFSPMLFFAHHENPFKMENRLYPIDFLFPNEDKYMINITIPEGYVVESLPKSTNVQMSDNLIMVKYFIANTDNRIQLSFTKAIRTAMAGSEYYTEIKEMFTQMIALENEKIVLKKR